MLCLPRPLAWCFGRSSSNCETTKARWQTEGRPSPFPQKSKKPTLTPSSHHGRGELHRVRVLADLVLGLHVGQCDIRRGRQRVAGDNHPQRHNNQLRDPGSVMIHIELSRTERSLQRRADATGNEPPRDDEGHRFMVPRCAQLPRFSRLYAVFTPFIKRRLYTTFDRTDFHLCLPREAILRRHPVAIRHRT